jgi:hypothetical protein
MYLQSGYIARQQKAAFFYRSVRTDKARYPFGIASKIKAWIRKGHLEADADAVKFRGGMADKHSILLRHSISQLKSSSALRKKYGTGICANRYLPRSSLAMCQLLVEVTETEQRAEQTSRCYLLYKQVKVYRNLLSYF